MFRSVKEVKLRLRAQSCCCGDDSAFLGGVQTRRDLCPVKGTCMTESPTRATMFTKGVTMVPRPPPRTPSRRPRHRLCRCGCTQTHGPVAGRPRPHRAAQARPSCRARSALRSTDSWLPRVLIFIDGSRLTVPAPPTLLPCSAAAVSVRSRSMIASRSSAQQATST